MLTNNSLAPITPQFLTVSEVVIILNVSKKMVYRWIKEGKLFAFRAGGNSHSTRISREALEKFVQQYTMNGKGEA